MPKPRLLKFFLSPAAILLACSALQAQSIPGKIVYADEPGRIQVINADGTGQTMLTEGSSDDDPVYSPDGSKIAFSRRSGFKAEICVMNADGTNVVQVTSGDVNSSIHNSNPSWSPDGTQLVFFSDRSGPGKTELWIINADGSGLIRLTNSVQLGSNSQGPVFSADSDPAWAPDGSKIAFVTNRDGADTELYLINPDGSNPERLTTDSFDDRLPAWSPDSQRIAFSKSNGGAMHTINRDGTNLESVLPLAAWPAWSPDGLRLAFVQNDPSNNNRGTVFIAKPDGTDKVKVTNNPNGARAPSWAPNSSPPIPTFTISGHVTDPNGAPVSGASLTMFTERLLTTQSDGTGAYSFTGLSAGTYRIDASKPGFGFIPPSITLTNITSNQTADFTAFIAFSISGQVSLSGSSGAGLPITLSGSQSRTVFTEVGGVYSFNVLPAGGNYTVSINSPFFIVTPASITFNNLSANQVANFSAVIARFTISGTTRRFGLPKPGITVRLFNTSGSEPLSTTTDANGHYAFTDVLAGGPYSVELASANYLAESKGIPALDSDKIVDFELRSANNIGFSRATFTVLEGTPTLQISVFRGGNNSGVGPITVDYATADGTAKAGLDYTAVSGTLDFPEGTFSRTITIPILDDQTFEGSEQFSLTLSNPTGEVDLATVNSAAVTIADNEIHLNTEANSDRAIALNTMTMVGEPFSLTTEMNFGVDQRTRISLFVEDLRGNQTFPTISVDAVDAQQNHFQLPLEVVGFSSVFPFQQLVVRLPDNLSTGELLVTVTVNGHPSNAARISIKP